MAHDNYMHIKNLCISHAEFRTDENHFFCSFFLLAGIPDEMGFNHPPDATQEKLEFIS